MGKKIFHEFPFGSGPNPKKCPKCGAATISEEKINQSLNKAYWLCFNVRCGHHWTVPWNNPN